MSTLAKMFFRGLAAILPLALTGYLVWAAVVAGETMLHGLVSWALPQIQYWPGMGFAMSIVLITMFGMLMYSFVVRTIYRRFTALLARIPIVKSIYRLIVDVVRLVGSEKKPFHQVVLVQTDNGTELVGLLTRDNFSDMPSFGAGKVAVYTPMSYQLGGFTLIVAKERVR